MPTQHETDRLLQQVNYFGQASPESLQQQQQQQQGQYYFLNKSNVDYQGGTTATVKDTDGGVVLEDTPMHSDPNEFAPRPLIHTRSIMGPSSRPTDRPNGTTTTATSLWGKLFGNMGRHIPKQASFVVDRPKPRKAPIKIEPKVFFSNERTFLAWMHLSVILAGASIAILAFTDDHNPASQIYGVVLLPVSIAFVIYSMVQYQRRAYMIRNRLPGPYEDTVGPTVLCVMLMLSIVVQFGLRLYDLEKH